MTKDGQIERDDATYTSPLEIKADNFRIKFVWANNTLIINNY